LPLYECHLFFFLCQFLSTFVHSFIFFSDHIILFSLYQQCSCLFLAFMISNSFSPLITRLLVLLFRSTTL
jgi:hypothetical protein